MTPKKTPAAVETTTSAQHSAIFPELHDIDKPNLQALKLLADRAGRRGASLTVATSGNIVIQRGSTSWHCGDRAAANAVIRRLGAAA